MAAGRSGLLHATTGSGKTYAVWFGALARAAAPSACRCARQRAAARRPLAHADARARRRLARARCRRRSTTLGLGWIDRHPHRRHAAGRARAPGPALSDRAGHDARIAQPDADARGRARRARARSTPSIVDEWHELMGSKRGVQVQLALARLRRWNPRLVSGACRRRSATSTRRCRCCSATSAARWCAAGSTRTSSSTRCCRRHPGRFSWGGHLGKQMQQPVVEEIERSATTLVFVNMRSQAEAWYQLHARRAARLGRRSSRCTTARSTRRCATGSSSASRKGA